MHPCKSTCMPKGVLNPILCIGYRAGIFFDEGNDNPLSEEWSIVDDLLNVAAIFKLLDEIRNMILRGHIYPKSVWKQTVWDRGWSLEDTYYCLDARLHKEPDLLIRICPNPRYLTWWSQSNKYPNVVRFSEIMAKMISHASLLKCDDVRLKHLPYGNRACSLCDLYLVEDIFHTTMQCPGTQHLRNEMFAKCELNEDVKEVMKKYEQDTMSLCLEKCPNDCCYDIMDQLWCITGRHISGIYRYSMC